MSLRKELIKLAYQNPSLRGDILPLVKTSGIEDELKGQKFPNPETGNQVSFGSLPPKAQAQVRKKFNESKEKKEEKSEKSEKNPYSGMSKKELTEKKKSIENFEWSKGKSVSQNKKKLEKQKGTIQYLSDVLSGKKKPSGTDFDDNKERESKLEKAKEELKQIESDLKKSEGDYEKASEKAKQIDQALKSLGGEKSEKKSSLRSKLVRLAYTQPQLRADILPLVTKSAGKHLDRWSMWSKLLKRHNLIVELEIRPMPMYVTELKVFYSRHKQFHNVDTLTGDIYATIGYDPNGTEFTVHTGNKSSGYNVGDEKYALKDILRYFR